MRSGINEYSPLHLPLRGRAIPNKLKITNKTFISLPSGEGWGGASLTIQFKMLNMYLAVKENACCLAELVGVFGGVEFDLTPF